MSNDADKCRHCDSMNLVLSKWIYKDHTTNDNLYHYKAKCGDCKKSYHLPRNQYVFDKVKNLNWSYSKR